jgi:hypothetical protein
MENYYLDLAPFNVTHAWIAFVVITVLLCGGVLVISKIVNAIIRRLLGW